MAIVDVIAGFYALLTRWCGHAFEVTDALNERTAIAHSPCQTIVVVTNETGAGTVGCFIAAPSNVVVGASRGTIVAGKIVDGADVIVVAAGGAIAVTILPCLNDIIATGGSAIVVAVGVATASAAIVVVNTFGD